jgi:uncharacterized membrane protein YjdF
LTNTHHLLREHSYLLLGDWNRWIRDPIDLLRLTYLAAAIVFAVIGNFDAAVRLALTFGIVVIARVIALPRPFDLGFVLGMMLQAWGNALNLFNDWGFYDNIVHVSLTAFAAPVFYIGLARLEVVPDLADDTQARHHSGIFVITLSLALAFGAVYEVYEWAADNLLGANLAIGETDTITDLFDDAIGGVIGGALLVVWATYGWGTVRRVGARRLRQGRDGEPGARARAQARRQAAAR